LSPIKGAAKIGKRLAPIVAHNINFRSIFTSQLMQLGERNWKEAAAATDKIVVVPLGAHEQHGHHLPLLTDAMIGEEIVRRAEAELQNEALFAPMLWLGHSPHHLEFPGTLSVSSETYIRVIEDVAESLIRGGFRRLLFFNSHAGNMTPASVALGNIQIRRAGELPDLWLLFASWFTLAAPAIAETGMFTQDKISHACEWETSQILAIHPELVQAARPAARFSLVANGAPSRFFHADYSGWGRVDVARRIEQNSPTGAFGWPELAGVEKGEKLFELAAQELVNLVREFAGWPAQLQPEITGSTPGAK
jgi:creatinine amidohydrolase